MAVKDLIHGGTVSYCPERRTAPSGRYGNLDEIGTAPRFLWPGLSTNFGVDVEEKYEEIQYNPAEGNTHVLECVRNVKLGEELPFNLTVHPQVDIGLHLLQYITGSATVLEDQPDSTSWLAQLAGKYRLFTGVMFEDYKFELPGIGVAKETISGFAGHRAAVTPASPADNEALEDTSRPIVWSDISAIKMGSSPYPEEDITHCLSDFSFGFASEIAKTVDPTSELTTKICGVRVKTRKMFVSLKLGWVDQTFLDIVTNSTKQYLTIVFGTSRDAITMRFGGLYFPKYISTVTRKELVGDAITSIGDKYTFTYNEGPIMMENFNIVVANGTSEKTEILSEVLPVGNTLFSDCFLRIPQLSTLNKTVKFELLTNRDNVISSYENLDASSPKNVRFGGLKGLMNVTKCRITTDANVSSDRRFNVELRGLKQFS